MKITDFIPIAKQHYSTDLNISENDYMCLALMRLIQETSLKDNYSNLRLIKVGNEFALASFQMITNYDPVIDIMSYSNGRFIKEESSTLDNVIVITDEKSRDLVVRFNETLQDIESFSELHGCFSFDEISQLRQLLNIGVSSMLPFYLTTDYVENNESTVFNDSQQEKSKFLHTAYYSGKSCSEDFKSFAQHTFDSIREHYKTFNRPFTFDEFDAIGTHEHKKVLNISGLSHITFDEELIENLVANSPDFLNDTFVGSLFKYDNFNDVMLSYFDHVEIDSIKFQMDLNATQLLEEPSIDDLLNSPLVNANLNQLFVNVFQEYPTLSYDIQDIKVMKYPELIMDSLNSSIDSLIDKFYFYASEDDIKYYSPLSQERADYIAKFRLNVNRDKMNFESDDIKFISSNEFNVNGLLMGKFLNDGGYHPTITINSVVIDSVLTDEKIRDLVEYMYDYAKRTKTILEINLPNGLPYGSLSKDRFLPILEDVNNQYKNDVVMILHLGALSEKNKLHLAGYALQDNAIPYEELPKLKKDIEKIITEHVNEFDTHIEFKIDEFIATHKASQK